MMVRQQDSRVVGSPSRTTRSTSGEDDLNWEAIGALGEIISAAAVVVTLVYLAGQVRQATRATQAASFQAASALEQERSGSPGRWNR